MIPPKRGARRTVAQFFNAANPYYTGPLDNAPLRGQATKWDERLILQLGLWINSNGHITQARFKSTTCVTLVALAEMLCEWLEGRTLEEAATVDAQFLLRHVSGIPHWRANRANVVETALRDALQKR